MEFENYLNFTPLFYSEGNSTYMLSEVFKEQSIAKHFLHKITGMVPEESYSVKREQKVGSTGMTDLIIAIRLSGRESVILIKCITNDYEYSSKGLLTHLYMDTKKQYPGKNVYLIYITQFTDLSISVDSESSKPPTIKEYKQALSSLNDDNGNLFHLSWADVHAIIEKHKYQLSPELSHILHLHKNWIREKCRQDFQKRSS